MKSVAHIEQPTSVLASVWVLGTILILGLTMGVWEHFGLLSLVKAAQESLLLVLFCYSLWSVRKRAATFQTPLVWPLYGLTLVAFFSAYAQNKGVADLVLFLREYMVFFLVFLAVLNLELPTRYRSSLYCLVGIIFLIQLPVSWLKYYFYGIGESLWIGTLHQSAGQLGLLFPLFAIAVLLAYGLSFRRNVKTIFLLMTLYGLFAVISEKRGIVFTFPLLVIALLFVCYSSESCLFDRAKRETFFRKHRHLMFSALASCGITIAFGVTAISSLNPSLDSYIPVGVDCLRANQEQQLPVIEQLSCRATYIISYTRDYLSRGYSHPLNRSEHTVDSNTNIQLGRLELIRQAFIFIFRQDPMVMALGYGPSSVSQSYILGPNREDILFEQTGLRGPSSSIVKILLESGLLGGACMLVWFALVGLKLVESMKNDALKAKRKFLLLCLTGVQGILSFDFFVYSQVFWSQGVLMPLYFLLLSDLYRSGSDEKQVTVATVLSGRAPSN